MAGGTVVANPSEVLTGDRLSRYQRSSGQPHPDILGQYVLPLPLGQAPEDVFDRTYRPLLEDTFRIEPHGAYASHGIAAPQYRLRPHHSGDSRFVTLEVIPTSPQQVLVTIWQRLPGAS